MYPGWPRTHCVLQTRLRAPNPKTAAFCYVQLVLFKPLHTMVGEGNTECLRPAKGQRLSNQHANWIPLCPFPGKESEHVTQASNFNELFKFLLKSLYAQTHEDPFYVLAQGHQPPSALELGSTGQHLQSEAAETPSRHTG